MRRVLLPTLGVLMALFCAWGILVAFGVPVAAAGHYEGLSAKGADRQCKKAERALKLAKAALVEARHVKSATHYYSTHDYSDFAGRYVEPAPVGRWVWLARDVGWEWSQIDMLMHIIARESSGCETVRNSQGSGATGLLQLMPGWYAGDYYSFPDFDPQVGRLNLYYGHRGWHVSGWQPWAL